MSNLLSNYIASAESMIVQAIARKMHRIPEMIGVEASTFWFILIFGIILGYFMFRSK